MGSDEREGKLIVETEDGLYVPEGDFHIDPWRPVARAVVTHAHSDHATPGSGAYFTSKPGAGVLALRVGTKSPIEPLEYGSVQTVGNVRVSLHPAGHILGSSQVRVERLTKSAMGPAGEVAVFSGDYKVAAENEAAGADRTCAPFEVVRCHTFITESTFGVPIYRWKPQRHVFDEINAWWAGNAANGVTSVIFSYALGKSQRLLMGVDPGIGPIACHGHVMRFDAAYRAEGVELPSVVHANVETAKELRGRALVIATPSVQGTAWLDRWAKGREGISCASASGWMMVRGTRRRGSVDRGFVLSDHADWGGLLRTIDATGAERVGVTHGPAATLVRYLNETRGSKGLKAFVVSTRYVSEPEDGAGGVEA